MMSTGTPLRGGITFPTSASPTIVGGATNGEESTIDRSSTFDGVLRTARNLRVEGQARGEVYCDGTLYIDEGGQVDARVVSANITVAGMLNGEVTCHGKLHLLPTGRVTARVATATLVIQEGATYEGELRMSNLDEEPSLPPSNAVASPPRGNDSGNVPDDEGDY